MDNDPLVNALKHAQTYLQEIDRHPVSPGAAIATLRERLDRPLSHAATPASQVIDDLVADTRGGLMASTGGRFFGWVIGGALPAAVAADWLTTVWDQNAASCACSPAMAVVEEICGAWLRDLFDLPQGASFGFVTGCQAAHTTALAAARHLLLKERGWDVERHGLSGAPAIRLVTGENRHESLIRAMRLLGLGSDAVKLVACNRSGEISLSLLEDTLAAEPDRPTIVCLQAGDLNTGAFDPFEQAIPLARRYNAWVHIDGAFGLWVAVSRRHRHRLKGVEQADSWASDGHKWLNLPFDSGFVFVARPEAHSAALTQPTSYSIPIDGLRNPMDWNPEWSRRARAFPAYAALRQLGRDGLERLIDRSCEYAARLVARIGLLDGAEVLAPAIINQGLVRFKDPDGDHDGRTDRVIARIQQDGRAWFGGTTWRGQRAMRISLCNWRTGEEDIDIAVEAVQQALNCS